MDIVVVPKSDGDVRVCVDMRPANEAIIRERHPIPTVEEILQDLNGSSFFSKIDLKWGFHQILLNQESRHNHFCHTPRALSIQAVDVWCYFGPRKIPAGYP